jgi:hypothetical protein
MFSNFIGTIAVVVGAGASGVGRAGGVVVTSSRASEICLLVIGSGACPRAVTFISPVGLPNQPRYAAYNTKTMPIPVPSRIVTRLSMAMAVLMAGIRMLGNQSKCQRSSTSESNQDSWGSFNNDTGSQGMVLDWPDSSCLNSGH